MLCDRQDQLPYLVLAECTNYDGSFLEYGASDLMSLAMQRSWALPSADWKLSYFSRWKNRLLLVDFVKCLLLLD
jgi:hypothetical protein